MTENPSEELVIVPVAIERIKRELYVGKVRSWSSWGHRSGSGRREVHIVCGQAVSKGMTLLRFDGLDALVRFRDAINKVVEEATKDFSRP